MMVSLTGVMRAIIGGAAGYGCRVCRVCCHWWLWGVESILPLVLAVGACSVQRFRICAAMIAAAVAWLRRFAGLICGITVTGHLVRLPPLCVINTYCGVLDASKP